MNFQHVNDITELRRCGNRSKYRATHQAAERIGHTYLFVLSDDLTGSIKQDAVRHRMHAAYCRSCFWKQTTVTRLIEPCALMLLCIIHSNGDVKVAHILSRSSHEAQAQMLPCL